MTDVVFDMDNMISNTEPGQLEVTTVQNRGGIPQTVTREIEYTVTTSENWATTVGIAVDVSVEIVMLIPATPVLLGVQGTFQAEVSTEVGKVEERFEMFSLFKI